MVPFMTARFHAYFLFLSIGNCLPAGRFMTHRPPEPLALPVALSVASFFWLSSMKSWILLAALRAREVLLPPAPATFIAFIAFMAKLRRGAESSESGSTSSEVAPPPAFFRHIAFIATFIAFMAFMVFIGTALADFAFAIADGTAFMGFIRGFMVFMALTAFAGEASTTTSAEELDMSSRIATHTRRLRTEYPND